MSAYTFDYILKKKRQNDIGAYMFEKYEIVFFVPFHEKEKKFF